MNSLFVLHEIPNISTSMLADIHLRPTLLASVKIVISAINKVSPSAISIEKSIDGIREYKYKGISVLPPYPRENAWVDWVSGNYHHFWWAVENAWHLDKELTFRFDVPQSNLYLCFSKLVEDGVARLFPKPDINRVKNWPSPFILTSGDEIQAHRDHYKTLKDKVRMKWTKRETPLFMLPQEEGDSNPFNIVCEKCTFAPPASGGCVIHEDCPFSVN